MLFWQGGGNRGGGVVKGFTEVLLRRSFLQQNEVESRLIVESISDSSSCWLECPCSLRMVWRLSLAKESVCGFRFLIANIGASPSSVPGGSQKTLRAAIAVVKLRCWSTKNGRGSGSEGSSALNLLYRRKAVLGWCQWSGQGFAEEARCSSVVVEVGRKGQFKVTRGRSAVGGRERRTVEAR